MIFGIAVGLRILAAAPVIVRPLEQEVHGMRMVDAQDGTLTYDVYVNPALQGVELLPNGEPKGGSPVASTLIYGREEAVLTDPGFLADEAQRLGDWVASKGRTLTDIFITHRHGDHWFAAGLLADRFGARVIASAGSIKQMEVGNAQRPLLWDKVYPGLIPPSPIIAVPVAGDELTLEGHELTIVEVGHSDTDDATVLHVPDLGLVVAGDVIYNGAHQYIGESVLVGGLDPWRQAISRVAGLEPTHIVAGHQNSELDDDGSRLIAETRQYLDDADELLASEKTAVAFFNAMIERYPRHIARTVLWAGASAVYGVREHPDGDAQETILGGWL